MDDRVFSKIDWIFCNESWHDAFNECITSYHEDPISYHCFLLVKSICPEEGGYKPFRFFNIWMEHPEYGSVLKTAWNSTVDSHSAMSRLLMKLSRLRKCLRNFNKNVYSDVVNSYNGAKHNLADVQAQLQGNPQDHHLLNLEKEDLNDFSQASIAYEKFLHQKSKITWLRLGDEGTGYFHSTMKSRGLHNRILSFMENGVRVDNF